MKLIQSFFKEKLDRDLSYIIFFILIFIFIRSIHFSEYLNFSSDQALFSLKTLELWRAKTISLIGPPTSLSYQGRYIFQGGMIYMIQLFFLLMGKWDPTSSSYIFMMVSAVMIIPLYFGMKYLSTETGALAAVTIYSLLPFYIDFSRFLWNPNFQFILLPIFIFFIGLFHHTHKTIYFLCISLVAGLLFQLHYQFTLILVGLTVYYFIYKKLSLKYLILFILGFSAGICNLLLFELRNNFYNTRTIILYFQHLSNFTQNKSDTFANPHYFLTISFLMTLVLIIYFKKYIKPSNTLILFITLFILALIRYSFYPTHGFGMIEGWNYPAEEKAFQIIRQQKLNNYAIVNLGYDTLAQVQRYLHYKNGINTDLNNYRTNKYLFIINKDKNYMNNPAYEVNTFKPSQLINSWKITNRYTLFLLKRNL